MARGRKIAKPAEPEVQAIGDEPVQAAEAAQELTIEVAPAKSLDLLQVTLGDPAARVRVQIASTDGRHNHLSDVITGAGVVPCWHGMAYDVRYQVLGHRERGPWIRIANVEVPARVGLTKSERRG